MTNPQPLVCVSLQFPPNDRLFSRIYDIAWNEFLPQLNRLNDAFEAAQSTHPSSEAKKIWSEALDSAATKTADLENLAITNYDTAFAFLRFLKTLHTQRFVAEAYRDFQKVVSKGARMAPRAQEIMVEFREDLRIAVSQITVIMSGGDQDISSFITESGRIMLEIATSVEECGAILEEFRGEFLEMERRNFDEENPPSDEELRVTEEKWQAFGDVADRFSNRWWTLRNLMRGRMEGDNPMAPPPNPTSPTMAAGPSKSRVSFWRRFSRRIFSCLSLETIS